MKQHGHGLRRVHCAGACLLDSSPRTRAARTTVTEAPAQWAEIRTHERDHVHGHAAECSLQITSTRSENASVGPFWLKDVTRVSDPRARVFAPSFHDPQIRAGYGWSGEVEPSGPESKDEGTEKARQVRHHRSVPVNYCQPVVDELEIIARPTRAAERPAEDEAGRKSRTIASLTRGAGRPA